MNWLKAQLVLFSSCSLLAVTRFAAEAQTITRGPYLQMSGTSSMVVRWRTDLPTKSRVDFGSSSTKLEKAVRKSGLVTDHVVRLSKLKPDSRYFYRVRVNPESPAPNDGVYSFKTASRDGAKAFKIWVLGDAGSSSAQASGENAVQASVRDAFVAKYPVSTINLVVMLGDNAYNSGTDAEYQRAVFDPYHAVLRAVGSFSTQGNHDVTDEAYYPVFTLPERGESGGVPSGTETYYSFDFGSAHFVSLNSELVSAKIRTAMLDWLRRDLAANKKKWTVVFFHHPPFSRGSHNSDDDSDSGGRMRWMRENALPIVERFGVDLVMTGHSHNYERSKFLHGYYGTADKFSPSFVVQDTNGRDSGAYRKSGKKGTVYVVAGNGGWIVNEGTLDHPAMVVSSRDAGSISLDFKGKSLDVTMITGAGTVGDYFSIRK